MPQNTNSKFVTSQDNTTAMFGSVGNLGEKENDVVEFDNTLGYSTITARVTAPTGGEVCFEGTVDGINWDGITLRSLKNDIFEQVTDNNSDFIGSISGLRKFRFRTCSAGSAVGTVMGRAMKEVSTLEGIEFGYPPHRFGYTPIHVDASYATAQTGTVIFTADSDKKSVVTDIYLVVSGTTDGNIKIFDETDATGNYLFKATVEVSTNKNFVFSHNFSTPYISSAVGNSWKITTSADIEVDLIGHGYQY